MTASSPELARYLVPMLDAITQQWERLAAAAMQPSEAVALASAAVAGLLVIVSAFVRTMIPLRWLAVGSNVGFMVYGALYPNPLMVVLHSVLLPVNMVRVLQMVRLTRRVKATAAPEQIGIWLRPYMRSSKHRQDDVIFERGEPAKRLYFLVEGRVELPDVGRVLRAGQMFGEIAFFTPDGRRSSRAVCLEGCTVMSLDEATFLQVIHQNPDFGIEVLRLVAGRLAADMQRLQAPQAQAPN